MLLVVFKNNEVPSVLPFDLFAHLGPLPVASSFSLLPRFPLNTRGSRVNFSFFSSIH